MQPQNSQAALAELQKFQSSAQDPNKILQNQRQQLGVDAASETVKGLRGAINNTTKLLKQIAPSVMGRTGSSLVTQAQATRQIANEQQPISEQLSEQGRDYSLASQDLGELQQRAAEASSGIYQGQQDKLSYLQNLYNTLFGREEAARQAAERERERQEAIRQFNERMAFERQQAAAAERAARRGSGGFSLGGATAGAGGGGSGDSALKNRAVADVGGLINRKGSKSFYEEIAAIGRSAGYGNTYDKIKLELIRNSFPGLFSGGNVKYDQINRILANLGGGGRSGGGW